MAGQKRVGILQINPQTLWRQGGGEIHARKYMEYGNNEEFRVELFDFQRPRDYDLLHYFGSAYQLNEFGKYARLEGIRVVGTPILFPSERVTKYRAMLAFGNKLPFRTTLNLRQELLLNTDLLFASSDPEGRYLSRAYGVSPDRIHTVFTGVDESWLDYRADPAHLPGAVQPGDDYVLMVGRVTPLKNQLRVARLAARDGFSLVIAGEPGADDGHYAQDIRTLSGKHPNVRMLGGLGHASDALRALYAFARCHVLFSNTETSGLVNAEAMAAGCPAISRPHATLKAIYGDHLVYAGNDDELSAAIRAIPDRTTPEGAHRIARCRDFVREHMRWPAIIRQSQDLYRQLLEA